MKRHHMASMWSASGARGRCRHTKEKVRGRTGGRASREPPPPPPPPSPSTPRSDSVSDRPGLVFFLFRASDNQLRSRSRGEPGTVLTINKCRRLRRSAPRIEPGALGPAKECGEVIQLEMGRFMMSRTISTPIGVSAFVIGAVEASSRLSRGGYGRDPVPCKLVDDDAVYE
ncbi:hypothetical protein L249_6383 [Ophiocordyceps polyrhachis-furcata BCC 54312]|uniref:Uncharacterized protein n=1 Tax=Ophiocordyceps polyrhachis-furcata BCC 54312 TaxID=1330021 RepID=A0A367LLL3_9HYPO|nr:hypothetical protein L249_6383 [Ophiocordyceps polyrhachis-furcata BCC 54312]